MFTGLIETIGAVTNLFEKGKGRIIGITPDKLMNDIKIGDSISVDGVCLTIELMKGNELQAFAMSETLKRSTFKNVRVGQKVNLERALTAGGRLDGHFVTGHVDCVGEIISERREGDALERWIKADENIMAQIAEKGSVAVDGISLTVAYRESWGFSVALIPHSLAHTTAQLKKTGDKVNIETDILAKYTDTLLKSGKEKLTFESLKEMGY